MRISDRNRDSTVTFRCWRKRDFVDVLRVKEYAEGIVEVWAYTELGMFGINLALQETVPGIFVNMEATNVIIFT